MSVDKQVEQVIAIAQGEFSPQGFYAFYWLVANYSNYPVAVIPQHAREWIEAFFRAKEGDKGLVCLAFRGSAKTTTFDVFAAYFLGHHPKTSNLLIRGEDKQAKQSAAYIADLIKNNVAWKAVFPQLLPDESKAWGAESGYEIQDTSYETYEEWRGANQHRHDPSILSAPYNSKGLQGRHPDGILMVDDILTPQNTTSEREHERVMNVINAVLEYAVTETTWKLFIGTPWFEHDVYHRLAESNSYDVIRTPALDVNGEPVWPEVWPKERVEQKREGDLSDSKSEFYRMMLLDVSPRGDSRFKFQQMDASLVDTSWPIYGGVDYASVQIHSTASRHRSHFALAYVMGLPQGGALVYDGVVTQWTRDEGVMKVLQAQRTFENWRLCAVESDGKGEEFITDLMSYPELKLVPMPTKGKAKADRLEQYLGPLFNTGRIRVSNASTPFLDTVRRFLSQYPNVTRNDSGWDCLDAIYVAVMNVPNLIPVGMYEDQPTYRKPRRKVDWSGLGHREYG